MEYTLKLTAADLSILSAALGEMPFKVVAPLVGKINAQIAEQEKPAKGKGECKCTE